MQNHEKKIQRLEKKLAKLKQPSMPSLRCTLWKLTSKIVRLQSDRCYTCDAHIPVFAERQAGHHFSQGAHGYVRYDMRHIRCQCVACNMYKSGNQAEFAYRLRKELGDEEYESLYRDKSRTEKLTRLDLETKIQNYKLLLNEITKQDNP